MLRVAKSLDHITPKSMSHISSDLGIALIDTNKALDELTRLEFPFRIQNDGKYLMTSPVSWLSKDMIQQEMGDLSHNYLIELVGATGSTNSDLLSRKSIREKNPKTLVRIAELQQNGRGRRGRKWITGLGDSLTFSLLHKFNMPASVLPSLTLVVGVAVIRSLRNLGGQKFKLKWPNDIIRGNMKVGGILTELGNFDSKTADVVIGIGLNIKRKHIIENGLKVVVSDLYREKMSHDRNQILVSILKELHNVFASFEASGFTSFSDEYEDMHYYHNRLVTIETYPKKFERGSVIGVGPLGELILKINGKRKMFNAGEIKLESSDEG